MYKVLMPPMQETDMLMGVRSHVGTIYEFYGTVSRNMAEELVQVFMRAPGVIDSITFVITARDDDTGISVLSYLYDPSVVERPNYTFLDKPDTVDGFVDQVRKWMAENPSKSYLLSMDSDDENLPIAIAITAYDQGVIHS